MSRKADVHRYTSPYQKVWPIIAAGIVAMCFIPALLFAWRGTYSRPMYDDFVHLADARDRSVFEAVVWHRNEAGLHGGYSAIVVLTLYGTLGIHVVQLFLAVALGSIIAAGTLLTSQVLKLLGTNRARWRLALMTNALLGSATAFSFYGWKNQYWYSANVRYLVPLASTVLLLSLLLHIRQSREEKTKPLWMLACAALAFWTAGFSETYSMTLALALTVLLAAIVLAGGTWRKRLGYPLVWSWLATGLGGLTVLTAPSVAMRAGGRYEKTASFWHEFPDMIWSRMLDRFGDPDVQLAFALMVAVGILVGFALPTSPPPPPPPRKCLESATVSGQPAAGCWLFGLICQLLFLPLLLSHTSYEPVILGRYSSKYFAVIALNALLLAAFAWALRRRWHSKAAALGLLAGALGLFLMLRFLHVSLRVEMVLWLTLHSLLLMTAWQLSLRRAGAEFKRFAVGMGIFYLIAAMSLLWMTSITVLSYSPDAHGVDRAFTAFVYMVCWSGIAWGIFIGWTWHGIWERAIKAMAMLIILATTVTIATGVIADVAAVRPYSEVFDKIDAEIRTKRKSGERHILIETPILCCRSDLARQFLRPFTNRFYDVDSIAFDSA